MLKTTAFGKVLSDRSGVNYLVLLTTITLAGFD
jgi:hypothetical protein